GDQAVSHVRLVGDYRQEKTRLLQLLEAGRGVGIQPEILQPSRGEAAPVTNSGTTITPSRSRNTAGLNPWARLTISSACVARLIGLRGSASSRPGRPRTRG